MSEVNLFTPGRIDGFETRNRIIMAPMTRNRANPGAVPSEMAVDYYAQRASAGLIISEGSAPSAAGLGYARTPAIETAEQILAWKKIVDAVHRKGGRMFLQLMHVGRIAHSANRLNTDPIVAPSAIRAAGQIVTDTLGLQDFEVPRALETEEIKRVIKEYGDATRNALLAGFDGVELHAASGYLPMQFLSTGSNIARTHMVAICEIACGLSLKHWRRCPAQPVHRHASRSRSVPQCRLTIFGTIIRWRRTLH